MAANYHWTILAAGSRANAGGRCIIKRSYRRWLRDNPDQPKHKDLERWARAHPMALQTSLERAWRASKRAWEQGNNSGDSAILRECTQKGQWQAENHDAACSVLGITVDWPGLAPCYRIPGGGGCYTTHSALQALVPRIIRIESRLYWRKVGHHVWTTRAFINGRQAATIDGCGGDSQYAWEMFAELEQRGLVQARAGDTAIWSPWRWCESLGITLNYESEIVKRRKDMHHAT